MARLSPSVAAEAYNLSIVHGGQSPAARAKGIPRSTFKERVMQARGLIEQNQLYLDHEGWAHVSPTVADKPLIPPDTLEAPRIRISVSHQRTDSEGDYDIMAIGDAHDSPKLSKDRFLWMGRHAHETEPDFQIQIGDLLTFDSLCRYDANDTLKGKQKPAFEDDIDSAHEALAKYNEGLDGYDGRKHCTLGNHEDRAFSFTDRTPETAGLLTGMLDNLFMTHGWTISPFGQMYYVGSVGFVHVPLNRIGKPYGGKTAITRIANDAMHDIVYGHDHLGGYQAVPKIGRNQKLTVLNLGCALPEGHVEPYVGHGMSGWWYGVHDIKIRGGRLHGWNAIPMSELERMYG